MRRPLVASFQVKPNPAKPQYYNVLVFETKAAMHAHWQEQLRIGCWGAIRKANGTVHSSFEAQATNSRRYALKAGRWHKSDNIGEIIFYRDFLGAGVVSHEMTHAALYWVTSKKNTDFGYRLDFKDDERLAEAVGQMCRQFWVKWFKKFPKG
jgi:hypothetical protein